MEIQQLGQRAAKSIVALVSRTFVLNIINFAGALVLTVFLSAEEFGIYVVTSTIIELLAYFSDIGLAGALIQKKDKLNKKEIAATFTIQQVLVLSGIMIGLIFTKPISGFYGLNQTAVWLYYALLLSFFLSSLKTIPSVLSERKLQFNKIVIPQIVETIVFNTCLIYLAWNGWGIQSYVVAVVARALTGTITIYILVPWRPQLHFSIAEVKGLLKFGIPYQTNSLMAMFKDKISLLILGKIIGLEGMGMLGWAEKWANLPLRYILDATVKVAFPLFSRLQDNLEKARDNLERAVYFISILVFPLLVGGYTLMPLIVTTIPKYSKWEDGITTFNLFLISAAVAGISTFLTNFLTGMGKVKYVLGLMIMWTVMTLTLYPILAIKLGYVGVAVGSVIISATSIIPIILVKRMVKFDFTSQVWPAGVSSIAMLAILIIIRPLIAGGTSGMAILTLVGGVVYLGVLYVLDHKRLMGHIGKFAKLAFRK